MERDRDSEGEGEGLRLGLGLGPGRCPGLLGLAALAVMCDEALSLLRPVSLTPMEAVSWAAPRMARGNCLPLVKGLTDGT